MPEIPQPEDLTPAPVYTKLTVNLTEGAKDALCRAAEETATSRTDVVNRALRGYDALVDAADRASDRGKPVLLTWQKWDGEDSLRIAVYPPGGHPKNLGLAAVAIAVNLAIALVGLGVLFGALLAGAFR